MKRQKMAYPLRMEDGVKIAAERIAVRQERSLNWQLNELLKIGLANFIDTKEKAQNANLGGSVQGFESTNHHGK